MDLTHEADEDVVATVAWDLAERIRDEDVRRVFAEVANLCQWHPMKAAQIVVTLAAWLDLDVTTDTLWSRVESITEDRRLTA